MAKASKPKVATKTPVSFAELQPLFRLPIDSAEVVAVLKTYPDHVVDKPSDGSQYVNFRSAGFSMLFRELPGTTVKGKRAKRVLTTIFLYAGGADKYERFSDPPFGISFGDSRDALHTKLGEPFDSAAKRNFSGLNWEKWKCDDLTVHTSFDDEGKQRNAYSVSVEELSRS